MDLETPSACFNLPAMDTKHDPLLYLLAATAAASAFLALYMLGRLTATARRRCRPACQRSRGVARYSVCRPRHEVDEPGLQNLQHLLQLTRNVLGAEALHWCIHRGRHTCSERFADHPHRRLTGWFQGLGTWSFLWLGILRRRRHRFAVTYCHPAAGNRPNLVREQTAISSFFWQEDRPWPPAPYIQTTN